MISAQILDHRAFQLTEKVVGPRNLLKLREHMLKEPLKRRLNSCFRKRAHTYKTFHSILEAHRWINHRYEDWMNGLSKEEQKALFFYCLNDYKTINASLRGIRPFEEGDRIKAKYISLSLRKALTPEDMIVYRGASREALGEVLKTLPVEKLPGRVFVERAFMSTSMVQKVAEKFNKGVFFQIRVPKGSKGAYIGPISERLEAEVLFQKGRTLRIQAAREMNGILYIQCRLFK